MRTYTFKVVVEPDDGRWHAHCPALDRYGAATWGDTEEEAFRNIREVVQLVVEELREDGIERSVPRLSHRISSLELCDATFQLIEHALPVINLWQLTTISSLDFLEDTAQASCTVSPASLFNETIAAALDFSNQLLHLHIRISRVQRGYTI